NFSTPVIVPSYPFTIHHQQEILLCGSCFSENIGQKLAQAKIRANINPFGIIYNPVSLANALKRIMENREYKKEDLYNHKGKWISWDHHGSFSSFDALTTLHQINENIKSSNRLLNNTDTVILTLGSAWVYEWKETGKIVANCHKVPSSTF